MRRPLLILLGAVGLVLLNDAETGRQVLIDTSDRVERQRYRLAAAERATARRRLLTGLGVEEVPIRTDVSYVQPLVTFFKSRQARRRPV